MNMAKLPNFQILDCTIRDGGYINNWQFDKKFVRELYRTLSKAGVDYIEIGYRGSEKHFDKNQFGEWRFSSEAAIREVISNIEGAKLALMVDYGKIEVDDFCEAKDSIVELVRIAAHRNDLKEAISLSEEIKKKGYKVALNAMGYNSYSQEEQNNLIEFLKESRLDYIYVVDSYGSLFPYQIKPIIEPLLNIPNIKVGFHPHNSLQMAFANTLEAINSGVHIIDSTIYGMGRAAGNLPTEILISYLERQRKDKFNSIPLLNIIDRYFIDLQKGNKWGYQLPYMLSGVFECHPNYAKHLVDAHEYTIEDIWKAMVYVNARAPVGFSKKILDDLISEGIIMRANDSRHKSLVSNNSDNEHYIQTDKPSIVPYVDRYKNRDFLILANGPSLEAYEEKINRFISKYNPIILGGNYLGGLFKPHYHAFANKRRFISYVDTVSPGSKLFVGPSISEELIREYSDRDHEKIFFIDALNPTFAIQNGLITTNCRTIAVLLLGVAIVMGGRRIFAVGMDGYTHAQTSDNLHFYPEKDEKENREMLLEMHHWCQRFLEQIDAYLVGNGKEGVHILTPTSYQQFYKGFENYL